MKKVQDFVAGLTKSRKSVAEIKKTISAAYEDKAWRFTSIFCHYECESWQNNGHRAPSQCQGKPKRLLILFPLLLPM
jgi:hypothetical protein